MLATLRPSLRYVAVVSTLAALGALSGCGGGGGGGGGGDSGSGSSSGASSSGISGSSGSTSTSSSSGSSTSTSSSGSTSPAPTALLVAPASGKAYWNKGVATQFSLKDAAGNAVAGPYTCATDNTDNLTVATDCSTVTGKRIGQQTITVSGGGVSGKATVKVIPQAQPIGTGGGSSDNYYNLVVTPDGRVLAWGQNSFSILGQGQPYSVLKQLLLPTTVKDATGNVALTGIVAVSAGYQFALALTEDGEVYSWGDNYHNELGRTASGGEDHPGKVVGPDGVTPLQHVVAISAGDSNALALLDDGTAYSWGLYTGRSGSDPKAFAGPVAAVGGSGYLTGVVAVSAGWNWSAALLGDGRIVTWGFSMNNNSGWGSNLGQGAETGVGAAQPGYVISKATGRPVSDAVSISAGYGFGLALSSAGTANAWGDDGSGQTGQNTQNKHAYSAVPVLAPSGSGPIGGLVMVAAGGSQALALDSSGHVFSWGSNGDGQLGDGVDNPRGQESLLPATVVALGGINQLGGVAAVAAGYTHSMALASDGSLLIWGNGFNSNLGQGITSDTDSFIPLTVKNEAGTGPLNLGPMSYWPNLTQRAR
jgi:alpha-tubulin suppressor-like RCC1 family protein